MMFTFTVAPENAGLKNILLLMGSLKILFQKVQQNKQDENCQTDIYYD
ncbi:hypothetical protein [Haemophilus parainfluenzae]|nr:hypothetical protein [Haemophilus parainfluenzae]QOR24284.1 hypothetical protein INP90_07525 [Haemophilus parainfluenzae]